jgi:SAM-dependent methyltransferase
MVGDRRISKADDLQWWESLYRSNTTPWELGACAPPLLTYLKSPYRVPPGKIAVIGCGTGHDSLLFAQAGFEVTGIDFAPSAVQATTKKFHDAGLLGTRGFLLQRDLFQIHEYDGYFDYVLEHTCFCAIHPSRRRTYVYTVRDLLKPGGKLIALFWLLDHRGGPPYAVNKSEIPDLFGKYFQIDFAYEPQDSVPSRQGQELFMQMTRL